MNRKIQGLTSEEVAKSREIYGDNALKKEKRKGFFKRFLENLTDPIIRVLMIALLLQVIFSFNNLNYFELCGILAAILLSTTVSTASEYRSEVAFEKLEEDSVSLVSVLRSSAIVKIPANEIVVGDIVYVNSGEKIQADGTLFEGKLLVDQSALNGESVEIQKCAGEDYGWELTSRCKLFRGSIISEGKGIMRVGRVGSDTYYGMVAKDVQSETRISPLKLRLGKLASQISKIGYIAAALVGVAYLFNAIVIDNNFNSSSILEFVSDYKTIFPIIIFIVGII